MWIGTVYHRYYSDFWMHPHHRKLNVSEVNPEFSIMQLVLFKLDHLTWGGGSWK